MRPKWILAVLAICSLLLAQMSFAAVSAEEAAKLKTTLTPFGAERAGNQNGTIPAWTGGFTTLPAGFKSGDPRPDPFANEKPLFSINSQNADKYAGKLSDGTLAMFKKFPQYRLDIYPTHRTAAAPDWVYENTFKNATRAKTTQGGYNIEGAYGGIPFPIPKDGYEAIWNHLTAWQGVAADFKGSAYTVTPGGKKVMVSEIWNQMQYPFYYKENSVEKNNGEYWDEIVMTTAPAFKAGEAILVRDPVDQLNKGRQAWQYLTGQRRVRRAPAIAYDTPNFITSGFNNFDEGFILNGSIDRYQWKLLGKREIYVPYNENRLLQKKPMDGLGEHYPNPDLVRWELHRVWVVDATLAPGKRHVIPHRRFYLDEDTWRAVLAEGWDAQGQLWKTYYAFPIVCPDFPAVVTIGYGLTNIQTGAYMVDNYMSSEHPNNQYKSVPRRPSSFFEPDSLATTGVR